MFSPVLFSFSKLNSCLVLLFFLFYFHLLPCALSLGEGRLCDALYKCGNLTAGYPFWGVARPEPCGHPSLVLHCHNDNKTSSLIISGQMYRVFQIDNSSNTLRLARQDFLGESFCDATFTGTTLNPELFHVLPDYKSLFVYFACDPLYHNPANFTCPKINGVASLHRDNNYLEHCGASFNITVPQSYDPEEGALNLAYLGSVLRNGFKVKLKIDERPCQECQSSGGMCAYDVANPVCCKPNSTSEPNCSPMIPSGSSGPGPSKIENKKLSRKAKIGIGFTCGFLGAALLTGCLFCFMI